MNPEEQMAGGFHSAGIFVAIPGCFMEMVLASLAVMLKAC